jgi:hypothetical protein
VPRLLQSFGIHKRSFVVILQKGVKSKPNPLSPRTKAGPPRAPPKSLGVKGRLLAKLGMKRSQPIFPKPRVHTEKPSPKSPLPETAAVNKHAGDASKFGGLRIQVEKIEPGRGPPTGKGCNDADLEKGERYGQGSDSNSGEIRIPKLIIRGLSGLGSPCGALGEQPRVKTGVEDIDGPARARDRKLKTKERDTSGGVGSDSLGVSEKDFAKLLIRLGKRAKGPGGASDTTSRSESPVSDAVPAAPALQGVAENVSSADDLSGSQVLTSAHETGCAAEGGVATKSAGGLRLDRTEAPGLQTLRRVGDGEAFSAGHELSRFASACLMTSAAGASLDGVAPGGGSPLGTDALVGGMKEKEGAESSGLGRPIEDSLGGNEATEVGGLRRPVDDSRGASESKEQDSPVSPEDLAASDLMRDFLSLISKEPDIEPQEGEAEKRGSAPGGGPGFLEGADRMGLSPGLHPVRVHSEKRHAREDAQLAAASKTERSEAASRTLPTLETDARVAEVQDPLTQKPSTQNPGPKIGKPVASTSGRVLSPTGRVPSPTAFQGQGGLLSPRSASLHSALLERSTSKLTLGMKTKGLVQKRKAIMLTDVKPDPDVLAHMAHLKGLRVSKPVKKGEVKGVEESGKSGDVDRVVESEGVDGGRDGGSAVLEKGKDMGEASVGKERESGEGAEERGNDRCGVVLEKEKDVGIVVPEKEESSRAPDVGGELSTRPLEVDQKLTEGEKENQEESDDEPIGQWASHK